MALTSMQKRKLKRMRPYIISGSLVVILAIGGGLYWYLNRDQDIGGQVVKQVYMENVYDARLENDMIANRDEYIDDEAPTRTEVVTSEYLDTLKPEAVSVGQTALNDAFALLGEYSNPVLEKDVSLSSDSPLLNYFSTKEDAFLFVSMLNITSKDGRGSVVGDAGSSSAIKSLKFSKPGEPYGFVEPFDPDPSDITSDIDDNSIFVSGDFIYQSGDAIRSFKLSYSFGVDKKINSFDLKDNNTEEYLKDLSDEARQSVSELQAENAENAENHSEN